MATKAEALTKYNEQHKTTHTLASLGVSLLNDALRDAWIAYRRQIVLAQVDEETVV